MHIIAFTYGIILLNFYRIYAITDISVCNSFPLMAVKYLLYKFKALPLESTKFISLQTILQVESLTNQEEVELRAKIEALGLEVRKLPSESAQHLNEVDGLRMI